THDVIIIGSGAGGTAAAYVLAHAGLDVLLIERGPVLPRDGSTLDVPIVAGEGRFVSKERWHDRHGSTIVPQERFNLGGKTKWYGAALLRFSPHEFAADAAHGCRAWPIGYDDLAPYYAQAEKLLGVRTFAVERELEAIIAKLKRRGWRTEPLPMGLAANSLDHPEEAKRFDGFASVKQLKSDGEVSFLQRARHLPNLKVLTDTKVASLVPEPLNARRVNGVLLEDGSTVRAPRIVLAAGSLHSPRLLQEYFESTRLVHELACTANIGRNYKFHVLTAILGFSPGRKSDLLRKTTLFLHDACPHSSVQPFGFDGEQLAVEGPAYMPAPLARFIGNRVYGFFLQTEDGSHADNRIIGGNRVPPCLDYDLARLPAARAEHARLVRMLQGDLLRSGMVPLTQSIPVTGTAHACGTLVAGIDPRDSVVAADGRVHGIENLFVVDGSVLPRSSRANPALTIFAWSMRVADRMSGGQVLANASDDKVSAAPRRTDHEHAHSA
ncbi:MAG: GMC oxidoreductase, partial [Burkholderiales bacterium]